MNPIDYWYQKYMALKKTERIPRLTWEDIRIITIIEREMSMEYGNEHPDFASQKAYYTEALRRFYICKEMK